MLTHALVTAALALAPGWPCSEPAPVQGAPTADDLAAGLEKLEVLKQNRRWQKAREALLELLEEHRDQRYVLLHRAEVEGTFEQCAFWSSYQAPEPEDVVGGELISYSEKTGKLKIHYRNDGPRGAREPWNFEVVDETWLHPAVFKGPYSMRVLTSGSLGAKRVLLACVVDSDNHSGAILNTPRGSDAYRREDGEDVAGAGDYGSHVTRTGWLEVKVADTKVTYWAGGKKLVTGKKPKGLWGRVGFIGFSRVDEIEIQGAVETSWIQGLIDERVQAARAGFEETYDAGNETPDWLVRMLAGEGSVEPTSWLAYPGPDHEHHAFHLEKLEAFEESKEYAELASYARNLSAAQVNAEMRAWLLMQAHAGLGRYGAALESCEQVCALAPEYLPALVWRVALTGLAGPREEAIAEGRRVLERFPTEPHAAEALTRELLLAGRATEAREVLAAALVAGMSPAAAEETQELLARALNGPRWERTFEWKSKHYVVRSDLSEKLCFEAAEVLEDSYLKWDLHLRSVPRGGVERYPVYIFSGENGYLKYAEDVTRGAPENTAGLFSPTLKQLLIWNLPQRDAMFLTIRHEGFHQYFDQVAPTSPVWLNEGLAEYYETTERVRGRWKDGALQERHVETLQQRKGELPSFAQLARMDSRRFYADAPLHYAAAWAWAHFLLHSDKDQKQLFDTYLDALIAGENALGAYGLAFGDLGPGVLDAAFRVYLATLGA